MSFLECLFGLKEDSVIQIEKTSLLQTGSEINVCKGFVKMCDQDHTKLHRMTASVAEAILCVSGKTAENKRDQSKELAVRSFRLV